MRQPHPVILKATMNKYDRVTFAGFHVGKLGAIGGNALYVVRPAYCGTCQNKERGDEPDDEA